MDRRTFLTLGSAAALGTVTSIARAQIAETAIARDVDAIVVNGFQVPGDRGAGAVYVRGRPDGLMAMQAKDSSWWNLQPGPVIWAGWFGALANGQDDTEAFQRAIDYAAEHAGQRGGATVHIASGSYKVAKPLGQVEIPARDDGTHPTAAALAPEPVARQAYCLALRKGVSLRGEGEVEFVGDYKYGEAGVDQPLCIAYLGSRSILDAHIENIDFSHYFIGIGSLGDGLLVNLRYFDIHFSGCAIGFYARILERCYFDRITARTTGCVIAVGGQWTTRRDTWYEPGGYADKCYFGTIDNVYGRTMGEAENNIDKYFDTYFFKTVNNTTRGGPPESTLSVMKRFPYRGICGRCIYIMARYSRPSNANVFVLVSHAHAPRPAVWIDHPIACSGNIVYLEGCGFRDSAKRIDQIGVEFTDPYLGPGVKVPAFVKGYSPIVDAQFVSAERLVMEMADTRQYVFWSKIGPVPKER